MAPGRDRPYILAHIRMPLIISHDHEREPTIAIEYNLFADQPITIWRPYSKNALLLYRMVDVLSSDVKLRGEAREYPRRGFYDFDQRRWDNVEPEYTNDGLLQQPSIDDLITLWPGTRCNVDVLDVVPQAPDAPGTFDADQEPDRSMRGYGCQLLKDGQKYIFRLKKDRVIQVSAWKWGIAKDNPGEWTLPWRGTLPSGDWRDVPSEDNIKVIPVDHNGLEVQFFKSTVDPPRS